MAYVQKRNPIPKTGCGRRRMEQMSNPFKMTEREMLVRGARQAEEAKAKEEAAKQKKGIFSVFKKISGPCKAAAKRKFKVWPSAYASGWGVRCTKAGGPGSMGKSKK